MSYVVSETKNYAYINSPEGTARITAGPEKY